MISLMKRIEFDIGDKPWTDERIDEIAKCLDSVLSKQGDPFTRLLTSPEMEEVIKKITGRNAFQTSNGDILPLSVTKNYTVNNPWFVQTFHGFDCHETIFDFSAAFKHKEEVKTEPVVETPVETPKEEVKTETKNTKTKETKNETNKKLG